MGQTRGLEPPSAGTTIQCLNHLATPAMALRDNGAREFIYYHGTWERYSLGLSALHKGFRS